MDLRRPLDVVTPTLDAEVLTVLALPAGRELTTGAVQRLVERRFGERRSIPGIRRTLERLAGQGVVVARRAGRLGVYRLNEQHLAAGPILALATLTDTVLDRLAERIAAWRLAPAFAALLLPDPTGDPATYPPDAAEPAYRAGPDSDTPVHLLFVAPRAVLTGPGHDADLWAALVADLADEVVAWTGTGVVVHALATEDLREPRAAALVAAARRDGHPLAGSLTRAASP